MEENNGKLKLEHRVTSLEVCQKYIKEDLSDIKLQVFNEIPHKLKTMDDKFNQFTDSIQRQFSDFQILNQKQFIGILVSIILILLGIILSFFKL